MTGWLRRKRFDESAFLLRHLEIKTGLAVRYPDILDLPSEPSPGRHAYQ